MRSHYKTAQLNITALVYPATDQLQRAKVTARLLGFRRILVVGLYHYGMKELLLGKVQYLKRYGNLNRCVSIYHHAQLLFGIVSMAVRPLF